MGISRTQIFKICPFFLADPKYSSGINMEVLNKLSLFIFLASGQVTLREADKEMI